MIAHPQQRRKDCDARIFDMTGFPGTRRGAIAELTHSGASAAWVEEDNEGERVYYRSPSPIALCPACDRMYAYTSLIAPSNCAACTLDEIAAQEALQKSQQKQKEKLPHVW